MEKVLLRSPFLYLNCIPILISLGQTEILQAVGVKKEKLVSHYRAVIWPLIMFDCRVSGLWLYLSNRDDEYQVCIKNQMLEHCLMAPDLTLSPSAKVFICRKIYMISQRFFILIIALMLPGSCFKYH